MSIISNEKTEASVLNQYLKGTYMGIDTFKKFHEKVSSSKLKEMYQEIILLYDKHKDIVSTKITSLQDEPPVTDVGLLGVVSELFYNIKTITVDTDSEILEESKKSFKTGIIMMEKFLDENKQYLSEDSISMIQNILKENQESSTKLYNYNK